MIRPVLLYPNQLLRKVSIPYEMGEITSPEFRDLVRDLRETVVAAKGAAISAPQVGINKRLVVLHPELAQRGDVLVNPILHKISEETYSATEGCLSFPGIMVRVLRMPELELSAFSATGQHINFDCSGDLAQALQHELEHLEGKLLIDHARPVKREMITRRMRNKEGNAVLYGQR